MSGEALLSLANKLKSMKGSRFGRMLGVKHIHRTLMNGYLRNNPYPLGEFSLFLNPDDSGITGPVIWGGYEPQEQKLIKELVKPGQVVLDLGANIGFFTMLLSAIVGGGGRVYAFEPDPVNFSFLEKNVKLNKAENVMAVRKAVSSQDGEVNFYIHPSNKGDHRIFADSHHTLSFKVQTVKIDNFLRGRENHVDFIKMDIQGAEFDAVQGMRNTLQAGKDLCLVTEFWPYGLKSAGRNPSDYVSLLRETGFSLFTFDDERETLKPFDVNQAPMDFSESNWINLYCFKSPEKIPADLIK